MKRAPFVIAICVAGWAAAHGDEAAALSEGRWSGAFGGTSIAAGSCDEPKNCILTLAIARCGEDWCGVRVDANGGCGIQILRLTALRRRDAVETFRGELTLAEGSSPYFLHAWIRRIGTDGPIELRLTGDSGGGLKIMRRTFSFTATLAKAGELSCRATS